MQELMFKLTGSRQPAAERLRCRHRTPLACALSHTHAPHLVCRQRLVGLQVCRRDVGGSRQRQQAVQAGGRLGAPLQHQLAQRRSQRGGLHAAEGRHGQGKGEQG